MNSVSTRHLTALLAVTTDARHMKSLILIPSDPEIALFSSGSEADLPADASLQVCGVGLVASATKTASLISQHGPDRVFLLGIAGTFHESAPVGTAVVADAVLQYGIGIGESTNYQSSQQAGFDRFHSDTLLQTPDRIELPDPRTRDHNSIIGTILSVASASSCNSEAKHRRDAFPAAVLEDMESYSVAHACRIADVPLVVIRGVSNVAGDRDLNNWQVAAAMKAAENLLMEYLQ